MLRLSRSSRGLRIAAVASAAVLVAACGSSSKSSNSSSATTTGAAQGATATTTGCGASSGVRGVTGSTITVAGLVTVADFGTDLGAAAKARFEQANNNNELPCGRKINLAEVSDDQQSPDTNLSDIRQMVEQERVFAIVPALTPVIEGGGAYLNQHMVPTVGEGISPTFCDPSNPSDEYLFGFNGCLVPPLPNYAVNVVGPALTRQSEYLGKGSVQGQTAAVIGEDYESSKSGAFEIAASLASSGYKVVYTGNPIPAPPTTVTDYSPYVQALMTANNGKPPDAIYLEPGPANAFGMSRALQEAGYKGVIAHSTYAPQLVAEAKGDSAVNFFATAESSAPAMAQIVATLHAAGVTQVGQPELASYFSADMFVKILQKVGPDLTPQRFQQVASTFTYSIPNVIGPSYYPAGFYVGAPCSELVYSNGTTWTISAPFACASTALKKEGSSYVTVPYPSGVTAVGG
jgi:branched-chain amino acid transport system substrate-binding protein